LPSKLWQKKQDTPEEKKEKEANTLFVGNVPLKWTKKHLKAVIKGAVGDGYTGKYIAIWFRSEPLAVGFQHKRKLGAIKQQYDDVAADSKNGYVRLDSQEAVRIVTKAVNGLKAGNFHLLRADGVGEHSTLKNFDRKRSVFLGNLPYGVTEAQIRRVLQPAGTVDAVRIVRDRKTMESKGFAFARFEKRAGVKEALQLWNPHIQGRVLRIMKVEDQTTEKESAPAGLDGQHPAAKRVLLRAQRKARARAQKMASTKTSAALAGIKAKKGKIEKQRLRQEKRGKVRKGKGISKEQMAKRAKKAVPSSKKRRTR